MRIQTSERNDPFIQQRIDLFQGVRVAAEVPDVEPETLDKINVSRGVEPLIVIELDGARKVAVNGLHVGKDKLFQMPRIDLVGNMVGDDEQLRFAEEALLEMKPAPPGPKGSWPLRRSFLQRTKVLRKLYISSTNSLLITCW